MQNTIHRINTCALFQDEPTLGRMNYTRMFQVMKSTVHIRFRSGGQAFDYYLKTDKEDKVD